MRTTLLAAAIVFALSLSAMAAAEPAAGDDPVEMGRFLKAMPWLEQFGDVPHEVVKFESIPMLGGLSRVTEYYEIDPDVVASGYSYFFYVRGGDGDYLVGSTFNLVKLCRELAVVEELRKRHKGKEFASGVGEAFKGIGTGLGNLVAHPGQSFKSMGSAFRSMGRSVERAVGADPKVGKDERGVDRSLLGDGPAGDIRRAMAYELGIDVYTDNPELREILTELSQVKEIGAMTSFVVPYGLSLLDYFNPLSGDAVTEKLIRDYNPYDLRREVGIRLEPILAMNREDRASPLGRLLLNPNYTPREIAYIGKDLGDLAGVAGIAMVVDLLAGVDTPETADLMSLELRLYAFYHRRVGPLASFVPFRHFYAAIGADGAFRFMFVADTVRPWKHTAEGFNDMIEEAMRLKSAALEIWTTGDVDDGMLRDAARRGATVRENILFDKTFFPAPEQRGALTQ